MWAAAAAAQVRFMVRSRRAAQTLKAGTPRRVRGDRKGLSYAACFFLFFFYTNPHHPLPLASGKSLCLPQGGAERREREEAERW